MGKIEDGEYIALEKNSITEMLIEVLLLLYTVKSMITNQGIQLVVANCEIYEGIACSCITDLAQNSTKLLNCTREGGWSSWTKWSHCRKQEQRRRRRCDNPTPIGKHCSGTNIEKRSCKLDISLGIPEFVWGQWTTWNEWSECQCRTNKRRRTRHCLGQSCEGCPEEYGACEAHCPTIRKWSEWTEWVEAKSLIRFRAWCSVRMELSGVNIGLKQESRELLTKESYWSAWDVRPGVALRYRSPFTHPNISIDIEHQLISLSTKACVTPLWLCILCSICLISGFSAQCLIGRLFSYKI